MPNRCIVPALACLWLVAGAAAAFDRSDVPPALEPWIDWALHGSEEHACPALYNDHGQHRCAWPTGLDLDINRNHGSFRADWQVFAPSWLVLPGGTGSWPQDVSVNGVPAVVVARGGRPAVYVADGAVRIEGGFQWDRLPESFTVPEATGLITLRVNGAPIAFPDINAQGQLWLQARETAVQREPGNALEVQVFRRVVDAIPARVITRLRLEVAGEQREVSLGPAVPEGFIPVSLDSPLPARLEADGRLRTQLRTGTWQLDLVARSPGPLPRLARPQASAPWPAEEIWVFEPRSALRLVEVTGVTPIDPRQTSLPPDWQQLPAYSMGADDVMVFEQIRRGDPQPEPDRLHLNRQLWLDFGGGGFTFTDHISGSMTQGWRLTAGPDLHVGRAALDGQPQFITSVDGTRRGVEVRRGALDLSADGRLEAGARRLSVVGWEHDFHSVQGTLFLPPGWELFHASGIDSIADTWIQQWTLLDLFLVLIVSLAVGRLWGMRWGLLTLLTLVLIWHAPGAPRQVWLHLLAALALLRVLPAGRLRRLVGWYRGAVLVVLVILAVPFMVDQVRVGVFPQLARPWQVQPEAPEEPAMAGVAGPRAIAAPQEAQVLSESIMALDKLRSSEAADAPAAAAADGKQALLTVDPLATIQTGPGIPHWRWTAIELRWNGPVEQQQTLALTLLSPAMTLFLSLLRVALLALLVAFFLGAIKGGPRLSAPTAVLAAATLLPVLAWVPPSVAAEPFPPQPLLDELRTRLLTPPECVPRCAETPWLSITADARELRFTLEVLAADHVSIPLPVAPARWMPDAVQVDGVPAEALQRTADGLWLAVTPGRHRVELRGTVPRENRLPVPLAMGPQRVDADLEGWRLEGVRDDGRPEAQLLLTRVAAAATPETASLEPAALPAFAVVQRTLRLGLEWRVETRVQRRSPGGTPLVISVPLLAGESVTTANVHVQDGAVQVNLTPRERQLAWDSVLQPGEQLTLTAPATDAWVEVWRLDVSPIWHVSLEGIAVVHHQDRQGQWLPEWRPWPGESVTLRITRPEGVPGSTLTVDASHLQVSPGQRATDVTLDLTLRSSQGGQHTLRLPEAARLLSVTIDGAAQPIRQSAQAVTLPLHPGTQRAQLQWRSPQGVAAMVRTPVVDLQSPSVNDTLTVSMAPDRWVLAVGGPRLGPAVLFWGVLAVIVLLSVALGRIRFVPLKTTAWFLLGVGLSQVNVWLALVVVAWLLLLGLRAKRGAELGKTAFNLGQLGLGLLTLAALAVLFHAIQQGLLGSPDMQIAGNGSSAQVLNWYQDRAAQTLPTAWVWSFPLMVYRLLMLAWALWLAFALLRWLRWGWRAYSEGGLWRPFRLSRRKPADGGHEAAT